MTRKLLLIRHATTTAEKNVLLGKTDLPLSDAGINDSQILSKQISIDYSLVKFFVSGLTRARQTAEILFPGARLNFDERLNEADFGLWSGLGINKISESFPELMNQWASDPMNFRFPEGESVAEFIARIKDFLSSNISGDHKTLVLICHGGVIRFMICAMLGIDFSHHLGFEIKRPSLNVIDHDGKSGVLSGLNISRIEIK